VGGQLPAARRSNAVAAPRRATSISSATTRSSTRQRHSGDAGDQPGAGGHAPVGHPGSRPGSAIAGGGNTVMHSEAPAQYADRRRHHRAARRGASPATSG
jgi:hypothetical protein